MQDERLLANIRVTYPGTDRTTPIFSWGIYGVVAPSLVTTNGSAYVLVQAIPMWFPQPDIPELKCWIESHHPMIPDGFSEPWDLYTAILSAHYDCHPGFHPEETMARNTQRQEEGYHNLIKFYASRGYDPAVQRLKA